MGRRSIDRSLLEVMNRSQAHRGPDGEGYHLEPGVALGHRRLSIIDIDGGHQPLFNEDGSVDVLTALMDHGGGTLDAAAKLVAEEFGVPWVRLTLSKPGAIRGARDVGIRIERRREEPGA